MRINLNGVLLKCPNCGNKWPYKGKKKVKATCPDCNLKIKIQENTIKSKKKSNPQKGVKLKRAK